jgi:hypothetical protein
MPTITWLEFEFTSEVVLLGTLKKPKQAGRKPVSIAKALFLFSCLVVFLVLFPNKLIDLLLFRAPDNTQR